MNEAYTDDDKLLRYLRGELPDDEQAAIEKRLKEEPEFQKTLDHLLLAQAAIWEKGRKHEAEKLKELYRNQQKPAQTRPMFMRYAIAATILALMAVGAIFLLQKPADPQALFADAYTLPSAPEQLSISKSDSITIDSLKREAFANYNSRDFAKAETQLESLLQFPDLEAPDDARFYLGISQLEQGNTSKAIATFSQMAKNLEGAQWYTALAYLKAGDIEKAKEKLTAITADPEHFYVGKARSLLEKL